MALQSSGAISLNDVAGEFGGTTPHSLSEYYGAASGVPSSGTISLSNFYGTSSASYWIARIASGISKEVVIDSSGNGYVCGTGGYIFKYNTDGALQWQRQMSGWTWSCMDIDSSNNIYCLGYGGSPRMAVIAKFNSSGSIQWQRSFGSNGTEFGFGCTVDGSNNLYISGRTNGNLTGQNDGFIAKYNSSGTLQWQRTLGSGNTTQFLRMDCDSSNNVYVAAYSQASSSSSSSSFMLVKYNSSGTLQWQRKLDNTSNFETAQAVAVDSSNNIYVCGETQSIGSGGRDIIFAKYNTSGTLQWQRIIGSTNYDYAYSVTVDSSGNAYVGGKGNTNYGILVKYNSSGTLQWQRKLETGYYQTLEIQGLRVDSSGSLWITGTNRVSGTQYFVGKLPNDGSKTGTHGSYTYSSDSLTAGTSNLSSSSASLSGSVGYMSSATTSTSVSTPSFTSTLQTVS